MDGLLNFSSMISTIAVRIIVIFLVIRFLLKAARVPYPSFLIHTIARITNPLVAPLNSLFRNSSRFDFGALVTSYLIILIFGLATILLQNIAINILDLIVINFVTLVKIIIDTVFYITIAAIIISWIDPTGNNQNCRDILIIYSWISSPIRRIIPPIAGAIDLSPIVLMLLLQFFEKVVLVQFVNLFY